MNRSLAPLVDRRSQGSQAYFDRSLVSIVDGRSQGSQAYFDRSLAPLVVGEELPGFQAFFDRNIASLGEIYGFTGEFVPPINKWSKGSIQNTPGNDILFRNVFFIKVMYLNIQTQRYPSSKELPVFFKST